TASKGRSKGPRAPSVHTHESEVVHLTRYVLALAAVAGAAVLAVPAFSAGGLSLGASLTGSGSGTAQYQERSNAAGGVDWKPKVAVSAIPDVTPRQVGPDRVLDVYSGGRLLGSMLIRRAAGTMTAEQRNAPSAASAGGS